VVDRGAKIDSRQGDLTASLRPPTLPGPFTCVTPDVPPEISGSSVDVRLKVTNTRVERW
jgi:hypothetical protein